MIVWIIKKVPKIKTKLLERITKNALEEPENNKEDSVTPKEKKCKQQFNLCKI